jgi:endonuclease YncB( thermonuclease family)
MAIKFFTFACSILALCQIPAFAGAVGPYESELVEVLDGDTIRVKATIWVKTYKIATVRLLGVDTPEKRGKCDAEKDLAQKAKEFVETTLSGAEKIKISNVRPDKYGDRVLANVYYTVNGRDYSLAKKLKSANLAVDYQGSGKKHDWCVERSFWGLF